MANSVDSDQSASEEANWSGSTLFAKAGYIPVQQDKGMDIYMYALPKHAYSNILKNSPPKTENFKIKILIFFIFLFKT